MTNPTDEEILAAKVEWQRLQDARDGLYETYQTTNAKARALTAEANSIADKWITADRATKAAYRRYYAFRKKAGQ